MDKDRVEGSAKQAVGAVKEAAGKVTGDAKLKSDVLLHMTGPNAQAWADRVSKWNCKALTSVPDQFPRPGWVTSPGWRAASVPPPLLRRAHDGTPGRHAATRRLLLDRRGGRWQRAKQSAQGAPRRPSAQANAGFLSTRLSGSRAASHEALACKLT